jgi:hypothetical protein
VVTALWVSFRSGLPFDETHQRKFVTDSGFLSFPANGTDAINNYANALQILRSQGIDKKYWDGEQENRKLGTLPVTDFDKIATLVMEGAKSQELGIPSPNRNTLVVFLPNYGEIKIADFSVLPKVIAQIVKVNLSRKENLDRALILGKANIAMGVQFSAYDNKLMHMVGLLCKREGLEILEAYVKTLGDEDLVKKMIKKETKKGIFEKIFL